MEPAVVDERARFEALLDEFNRIHGETAAPRTFLEAAGYQNYEYVASNLLRFFFDPSEGHGLSGLFLNALLEPLGLEGVSVERVEREVRTSNGNFIDLVVYGDAHLVGVENKLFAGVQNPLGDYREHLRREAEGREVTLVLLCLFAPQPVLEGVVVVTYEEFLGRVRRDLGSYAADVPAQYLTFALDFVRTVENLRKGDRMNPAVVELIRTREDDVTAVWKAAAAFKKAGREKADAVGAIVAQLIPEGAPNTVGAWFHSDPNSLIGSLVHDVHFPSGAVVAVDAWIRPVGWQVNIWQRKSSGPKLSPAELRAWLAAHGVPFLLAEGEGFGWTGRAETAGFEYDDPHETVAAHVAAVVEAIARAPKAPGEAASALP